MVDKTIELKFSPTKAEEGKTISGSIRFDLRGTISEALYVDYHSHIWRGQGR
jgi:predicted amidohydrolase